MVQFDNPGPLMSEREVAVYLKASGRTIINWRQRGLIRTATHRITIIDEQVLRRIAASAMLT